MKPHVFYPEASEEYTEAVHHYAAWFRAWPDQGNSFGGKELMMKLGSKRGVWVTFEA